MSGSPAEEPSRPRRVLPVIVGAQFAGTSLWFAGNAIISDLQSVWDLGSGAVGWLTSAVQLGFIAGTLLFAVLSLADRIAPRRLFLGCALLGAGSNALIALGSGEHVSMLVFLRFSTGFFLAGIYPVGMKIAASWFEEGLGHALGLLVGALVLGTAFPHVLEVEGGQLPWRSVLLVVSLMAGGGGVILFWLVPEGPYLTERAPFDPWAVGRIFRKDEFRAAAFGYFGHMWELYAFWAFVPVLLLAYESEHAGVALDTSLWSFLIIAFGAIGCGAGGWLSRKHGSATVATVQIAISGGLCLLSPLLFVLPEHLFLAVLLVWGITVVGDSPQFSALNAQTAPQKRVGTALTITTSIGFFITIPSIQLVTWLAQVVGPRWSFVALAPGPLFGLHALYRLRVARRRAGSRR